MEYEHIKRIDQFEKNIKNWGEGQLDDMPILWDAINEDLDYSEEDKAKLLEIVGEKWNELQNIRDERLAREESEEQERIAKEKIEQKRKEGNEKAKQRREEKRNRPISEYENDELLKQYQMFEQNISRMVEASGRKKREGKIESKSDIQKYKEMKEKFKNIKSEIDKRGLIIQKKQDPEKISRKERKKMESEFMRDKTKFSIEQWEEKKVDIEQSIAFLEDKLKISYKMSQKEVEETVEKIEEYKLKLEKTKHEIDRLHKKEKIKVDEEVKEEESKVDEEVKEEESKVDEKVKEEESKVDEEVKAKEEIQHIENDFDIHDFLKKANDDVQAFIEEHNREKDNSRKEKTQHIKSNEEEIKVDEKVKANEEQTKIVEGISNNVKKIQTEKSAQKEETIRAREKELEEILAQYPEQNVGNKERVNTKSMEEILKELDEKEKNNSEREKTKLPIKKKKNIFMKIGATLVAMLMAVTTSIGFETIKKKLNKVKASKPEIFDTLNPEEKEYVDVKDNKKDKFINELKVSNEQIMQEQEKNKDIQRREILENIKIGDIINIEENISYSENSRGGGKRGKIGITSGKPVGEYEINGVAILNDENEIVKYSFNELDMSILELVGSKKDNERYAFHIAQIDGDERNATGWVNEENIVKVLAEQQNEQKDNETEMEVGQ